jgi:hypothetical protein
MSRALPRAAACLAVAATLLMTLAACDPKSDPITPRGAGFQQTTDGDLTIWFGVPCRDVVEVQLDFLRDKDDEDPLTYDLRAPGYVPSNERPVVPPPTGSGVPSVTGLTLGEPVDGLEPGSALPDDFDWRDFYAVDLLVKTSAGQAATYLITKRLTKESDDHPGEFYVQDQGWFDKSAFSQADGDGFKALCSSINPG